MDTDGHRLLDCVGVRGYIGHVHAYGEKYTEYPKAHDWTHWREGTDCGRLLVISNLSCDYVEVCPCLYICHLRLSGHPHGDFGSLSKTEHRSPGPQKAWWLTPIPRSFNRIQPNSTHGCWACSLLQGIAVDGQRTATATTATRNKLYRDKWDKLWKSIKPCEDLVALCCFQGFLLLEPRAI